MKIKAWIKQPQVASALGILVVVLLIWFVGIGLDLSANARFGLVLVALVLWVATLLVGQAVSRRAGKLLETMLRRQADDDVINAGADKRAEISLLRQRLLGAIDTLKQSSLGHVSGQAALYELPWYMIIGHPAAGKSSAILNSSLTFPFSDQQAVAGLGGTRNCDWFFSSEGILVDTAGRWATQSEDRGEWLAFLKLLKKHRARAPINGILLAISLPELARHQSEAFEIYVRQVRSRLHEISSTFGLQVPIYLLFTKLDLLGGFARFFEHSTDEERHRVWGATLSAQQAEGFDVARVVGEQFDHLSEGLTQLGEEKLARLRDRDGAMAHFGFPIEFRGLKEAVVKFVRMLTETDPYHQRPLVRGFYFTSALQEGSKRVLPTERVQRQFELQAAPVAAAGIPASASYFLRDLFREVVFPDQHLITRQTRPRIRRLRLAGMLAALLALCVWAGVSTWSFISNRHLLEQVAAERAQAAALARSASLAERLRGLEILQQRVETLYRWRQEGTPWSLSFGLYRGHSVEPGLRAEYFAALRPLMLEPVQRELERSLAALKPHTPPPTPAVDAPPPPRPPRSQPPARRPPTPRLPTVDLSQGDVVMDPWLEALWSEGGGRFIRTQAVVLPQPVTPPAGASAPSGAVLPVVPAQAGTRAQAGASASSATEAGYNALKTYLMLSDRERLDRAHLSAHLPLHWRGWLEATRGDTSAAEITRLAERAVAFYASQVGESDLPIITPKAELVESVRETLRTSYRQLSGAERAFNEIRNRANAAFAPMTVARILGNRDQDLLAGSRMVEGAFTREAWQDFIKDALTRASKGEIRGDDWVLATAIAENLGKSDAEHNHEKLLALYRQHYAEQWKQFLAGVAVQNFASPRDAAAAMTRLADPQQSPIKRLLARVAHETSWDNPTRLQGSLESATKSVVQQATGLVQRGENREPDSRVEQFGELGAQFAGVVRLMKGEPAPIAPYFEQLGKVKTRLAALTATDDGGAQARVLMQATLIGNGSELADALAFVDNTLLSAHLVSPDLREILRPLLVRPLMQSFGALNGSVAQHINQAWATEVLPLWRPLASRFPFANSTEMAGMIEINRFISPRDGVLEKFATKYLDGLVQRKPEGWAPRTWGGMGVSFNPAFLSAVNRLTAVGGSEVVEGDISRFELQPLPTPGLSEIALEVDGQSLRYRMGPSVWHPFSWPGSRLPGSRLQVVNFSGASTVVSTHSGRNGLIRVLAAARIEQETAEGALLVWPLKADSRDESDLVRFRFRNTAGPNPLRLLRLGNLALPERIIQ